MCQSISLFALLNQTTMIQIIKNDHNVTLVTDNGKSLELFDFSGDDRMMIEINGQYVFLTKADTNVLIDTLKNFLKTT